MKNSIKELISNVESYKSSIFAKEDVIDILKDLMNDSSGKTIFEKDQNETEELDLVDFKEKLENFLIEKISNVEITELVKQDECDFTVESFNQIQIQRLSIDSEALVRIMMDGFEYEFEVD